jgi:dTDP-4-dehydrorhamnose reductase
MRVLVTGAGGLLAAAIIREFEREDEVVAFDRAGLNVGSRTEVARVVADSRPDVVINCAAYNDVDGAEDNAPDALRINALAVRWLGAGARSAGAALVHFSTDFVFDGTATRPYTEDDAPNPRSVYAASKLVGEWFGLEHPAGYVLRVESLFGEPRRTETRPGSLGTLVARIRAGEPVPAFVDRTVSPTYTTDAASATRALLVRRAPPGLYHCVNSGTATWAEIATEAARLIDLPVRIAPITLDEVKLKAPRPRYCALSNAKLQAAACTMPTWQDALKRHLTR